MKIILQLILILSVLFIVSNSEATGSTAPSSSPSSSPSTSPGVKHIYNLFEIRNKQDSNECTTHFGNNQTEPFLKVYVESVQRCAKGCSGSIKIQPIENSENKYKFLRWSPDDDCQAAPAGSYEFTCTEPSKAYDLETSAYTVTCQTDNKPPVTEAPKTEPPKNTTAPSNSTHTPSATPSNSSVPTEKPNEQATTTGNSSSKLLFSGALILASILSLLL